MGMENVLETLAHFNKITITAELLKCKTQMRPLIWVKLFAERVLPAVEMQNWKFSMSESKGIENRVLYM